MRLEPGAEESRSAALENLEVCPRALQSGEHRVAHYYAGLAIECMLRAYLYRVQPGHEHNHNLGYLARKCGFADLFPSETIHEWKAKISDANILWRSNHRYFPAAWLARYLKESVKDSSPKLNNSLFKSRITENSAKVIVNYAFEIVGLGDAKWRQRTR